MTDGWRCRISTGSARTAILVRSRRREWNFEKEEIETEMGEEFAYCTLLEIIRTPLQRANTFKKEVMAESGRYRLRIKASEP